MKKIILQLFMLYFMFFITSCLNKDGKKNEIKQYVVEKKVEHPYEIELEEKFNNTENVPLSILKKQLKYIVLETNPDCLLRKINHIEFTKKNMFISDFYALYKFDINGKFIRKIGKKGRGPGEYRNVLTFTLDKLHNKIFLNNWGKMQEYDFDGNYIKTLDINSLSSNQYIINDDKIFFHVGNTPVYSNPIAYSLIITDTNAKPIVKYINHHKRKSKPGITISRTPLYFFQGHIRFMEYCVDTLYTVLSKILKPYAIFDLGRFKMNPDPIIPLEESGRDEVFEQLSKKLWIQNILEDNDYLYINLAYGFTDSLKLVVYNKNNYKITFLSGSGFINDLDGGFHFWPKYIYNDSMLVDYVDAYDFKKAIRDNISSDLEDMYREKYKKLIHIAGKFKNESNPVLLILSR